MLSSATLSLLSAIQTESHAAYSEGGLLYTYVEADDQAHFRFRAVAAPSKSLPQPALRELGRLIQASQGNYQSESVAAPYLELAQQLVDLLQADLEFDEITWSLVDGGHNMDAIVSMARRSDNRFFSLELMWSVD